ncbi:MAG: tetratricopeptide repeat protein, partial [Deltaproteobacteria bacterium]|nr:tetratricopeptide repeat protein [Deltaproteobacteria bacterium]
GTLERFAEDYWRHEAAYRVRMRLLGESHADTLMAREAFGLSCLTCGNPVAAMAHLSAVLDAAVAVSGPESGDSLRRLFNLGQATASAGDLAKAEELLALALMRHARSLGPQHELTGTVAEELSILRDSVSGGGHA